MRTSRSTARKPSGRRAHRPDQRVYRSLRIGRSGKRRGRWLGWTIAVLTVIACVWLAMKILRA